MNQVIYLFGSGLAFFVGAALVLAGVALAASVRRRWALTVASVGAMGGLILLALSAVPLPTWFYALTAVACATWLVLERIATERAARWRLMSRAAVVVVVAAGLALEVPYHVTPKLDLAGEPALYIFADSVTAGMSSNDKDTWPGRLARAHGLVIHDHSQMGAKVRTMVRKVDAEPPGDGLILLEIGGNDLLGTTTAEQFERDLDELLGKLKGPGRTLVMFELPLPPLQNAFGAAQRRLAAEHGVLLVPRRVFIRLLTADGATVDGIHLTSAGHDLMARAVWELIGPAYRE